MTLFALLSKKIHQKLPLFKLILLVHKYSETVSRVEYSKLSKNTQLLKAGNENY